MSTTTRRAGTSRKTTGVAKQSKTKQKNNSKTSKVRIIKKQIKSKEAYNLTMREIDSLMKHGEKNLSQKELQRLRSLAEAAERYEDAHDPLPLPESLPELIRMRMFQMQLNQSFVAKLLGVSDAKFSLIMSGKQKPDVIFIKAIHNKLQVDANLILQAL